MKFLSKLPVLTVLCAILGLVCLYIRQWFLRAAIDSKGLLIPDHPGILLSCLLLVVAICILCFSLRARQTYHFSPTPLSATSMLFFAVGYGITGWQLLTNGTQPLSTIAGFCAVCSALGAVLLAFAMFRKLRLHPFIYCPPVLFLMLFLICRYQQWSGEPELHRYLFQMLAVIFLMFAAYHRAALESDKKGIRSYLILSRSAIFFSIAAIPGSSYGILYGCCAVALLLDGFTGTPKQGD